MAIHEFRAEPSDSERERVVALAHMCRLSRFRLRGGQPAVNAKSVRDVILTDTSCCRTHEFGRATLDRFRLSRLNSGRASAARVSTGFALLLVEDGDMVCRIRATATHIHFRFGEKGSRRAVSLVTP